MPPQSRAAQVQSNHVDTEIKKLRAKLDKQDKPLVNITLVEWVVILLKIFIASIPAWVLAVLIYFMVGGAIAAFVRKLGS